MHTILGPVSELAGSERRGLLTGRSGENHHDEEGCPSDCLSLGVRTFANGVRKNPGNDFSSGRACPMRMVVQLSVRGGRTP